MFANNHHGDGHVAVWLPAGAGMQAALIEEAPETYFRPPYVGVSGWIGVELSKVDDEQLGALIREAFRLIDVKIDFIAPLEGSSISVETSVPNSKPRV